MLDISEQIRKEINLALSRFDSHFGEGNLEEITILSIGTEEDVITNREEYLEHLKFDQESDDEDQEERT